MTEPNVVAIDRIAKRFSGHVAVEDLSLQVPKGAVYGLLGPNGAGKTTTIRMIMNITIPDEGTIELFGDRLGGRHHSARIGYLPEERGLYRKMRVRDMLVFLAEAKGVDRARGGAKADEWLRRMDLAEWGPRKVEELSKGMQQKVQFIGTMLHEPELLILDEPFSGLDPINQQVLRDIIVHLSRSGATIIFSTHQMDVAEKICDHVCIIARGRKVLDGGLADPSGAAGDDRDLVGELVAHSSSIQNSGTVLTSCLAKISSISARSASEMFHPIAPTLSSTPVSCGLSTAPIGPG